MQISKDRYSDIDKSLAGFPYGLLQDFITFIDYIAKLGIGQSEVRSYLEEHQRRMLSGELNPGEVSNGRKAARHLPKCPVCGLPLRVEAVNNSPRRMIGGSARSWWVCPNGECEMEPILSEKGPKEELEALGIMPVDHHMRKAMRRKAIAAEKRRKRG